MSSRVIVLHQSTLRRQGLREIWIRGRIAEGRFIALVLQRDHKDVPDLGGLVGMRCARTSGNCRSQEEGCHQRGQGDRVSTVGRHHAVARALTGSGGAAMEGGSMNAAWLTSRKPATVLG